VSDPASDLPTLVREGWEFRFTTSEPRLSAHVAEYESLGFEVKLVAVTTVDGPTEHCSPCILGSAPLFGLWVRRKG
jgi:hypothetical protein